MDWSFRRLDKHKGIQASTFLEALTKAFAKLEGTENQFRYRVKEPSLFEEGSFRTKEITDGVSIIVGNLKGQNNTTVQSYRFDKGRFKDKESVKKWLKENKVKAEVEDKAVALQMGKPPKNDPRKTPAPSKDKKRGSDKNKPGSAKDSGGGIELSKEQESALRTKVQEHNAKYEGKGKKVTLGMLKAVWRRGAGAFSTSHRPGQSRSSWAMARVNAFLYLVKNGRPSNPNYFQEQS